MTRKGGSFKNTKLGKNVFRQIKRRGAPEKPLPPKCPDPKFGKKLNHETHEGHENS